MSNNIPLITSVSIVVIIWLLLLWLLKRVLIRRLRNLAVKTRSQWDDVVLEALVFPANFLIIASGLALFTNLLDLSSGTQKVVNVALKGSLIFAMVFFADSLIRNLMRIYGGKALGQVSHGVIKGIIRGFIIGIGVLIFLDLIGISITPILASLGIGSLAVALALQDTLGNFFAGIYVAVDQPVRIGDFIRLETGQEGYVTDIGWRSTRVRMLPNNTVIIPNAKLMGSVITNYYLPEKELAVLIEVGVHYASDLNHVERVVIEVARQIQKSVAGGVPEFGPLVRYHTFGESSINFTAVLRAREFTDGYLLKHEFIKVLHERFQKEGIVIPFPTRTLVLSPESISKVKS
ncbi:MAG: mechanosensitive ion channel family protein [Candidatus Omnitrophica bacterium]|nr:mechanosensitive ion channel family protein [Candidatus Omnitrophota bacterium]